MMVRGKFWAALFVAMAFGAVSLAARADEVDILYQGVQTSHVGVVTAIDENLTSPAFYFKTAVASPAVASPAVASPAVANPAHSVRGVSPQIGTGSPTWQIQISGETGNPVYTSCRLNYGAYMAGTFHYAYTCASILP